MNLTRKFLLLILFFLVSHSLFSREIPYTITSIKIYEIPPNGLKLQWAEPGVFNAWNNMNDFIVIVHISGPKNKNDYFQNNRKLKVRISNKDSNKTIKSEIRDISYLSKGGRMAWILLPSELISCRGIKIKAEILGQKKAAVKEDGLKLFCGE
jgi:hypothetical protein